MPMPSLRITHSAINRSRKVAIGLDIKRKQLTKSFLKKGIILFIRKMNAH